MEPILRQDVQTNFRRIGKENRVADLDNFTLVFYFEHV